MNPFDLFGRKQPMEIPVASPDQIKILPDEKIELVDLKTATGKIELLAIGPFSRRQVIQYPFLRSLWADIERITKNEQWNFSKFTYQGWKDIYGDEYEVIRKEKTGDIIGLIWYAHGHWQPVMDTDTLANIHYAISEFYIGSTSEFWWGVEQGFDYRPEVKDIPGYDIGETLRLHFHKELSNGNERNTVQSDSVKSG